MNTFTLIVALTLAQSRGSVSDIRTINGTVKTAPADYQGTLFGHQRTANPLALADLTFGYGIDSQVWAVDGGGTIVPHPFRSLVDLQGDGGVAYLETQRKYRYQAGRQQTVLQTVAVTSNTGVARWGNFCFHDGLYWEVDGGALSTCRRSGAEPNDAGWTATCEPVAASALPSSFNISNGNIYEIRFAWLGVHEVDWWINGTRVKQNVYDSLLPYPYMGTATLPLRAEAWGTGRMSYICSSVSSEGGAEPPMTGFSYTRAATKNVTAAAGILPIIAIRPVVSVATSGVSVHSHVELYPHSVSCQANSPSSVRVYGYLQPTTLTGATWAIAPTASSAEIDVAATAVSGGIQVLTFGADDGSHDLREDFGITRRALRNRALGQGAEVFVIAADVLTGNQDITCSIEWHEIR